MRTLHSSIYINMLKIDGTATAGTWPASGSYIDVGEYTNFAFLVGHGANTATLTAPAYTVKQATYASGTLKVISGAAKTMAAAGDDTWCTIEVETAKLDIQNGYDHVAIRSSAGRLAGWCVDGRVIFFLGWNARHLPVTQSSNYETPIAVVG